MATQGEIENDEALADIAKFHGYVQSLGSMLREVSDQEPEYVEGKDRTGCVWVKLSRGDFLSDVTINEKWQQRLGPSDLGAAVMEAARSASEARAAHAASEAVDSGWLQRVQATSLDDIRPIAPPTATFDERRAPTRSLEQFTDFALDALAKGPESPTSLTFTAESETSDGWVTVSATALGISACIVGSSWAATHSSTAISWAVNEAARDAQAQAISARNRGGNVSSLDQVIHEAMAFISDAKNIEGKGL